MRVVLHIGLPKTGSTSIQSALSKSRSSLKKQGLFYPRIGMHENHNLLSLPFSKNLPRTLGKLSKDDRARERTRAQECWRSIGTQVAREKPKMVVLSSEYFAFVTRPDDLISTVVATFPHAESFEVIAYLRRPSQHYVSLTQQKLRASSRLPPPTRIEYSKILAPFQVRCSLKLREMHPRTLINADIVADFCQGVLSIDSREISSKVERRNESVSAEAMALLQEFRRYAFGGQDHTLNQETTRVIKAIRSVEASHGAAIGFTPPRLYPELEQHLDYATSDNRSLKEQFGFTFYDFGDSNIDAVSIDETKYRDVAEIVFVDSEKLGILRSLVLKELATQRLGLDWISGKIARWRRV